MLNMSDMLRGYTDTIILGRLSQSDSYGYEINKSVVAKTGGLLELKEATLYTTFRRLEGAKCIHSYWGDETTGARRRYYAITPEGRRLYEENVADWHRFKTMMDQLLLGGEE